jgi:hypothetical protein
MELDETDDWLVGLRGVSPLAQAPLVDGPQHDWICLSCQPESLRGLDEEYEQNERGDAQYFLWRATESLGSQVECHVAQVLDEAKDRRLTLCMPEPQVPLP